MLEMEAKGLDRDGSKIPLYFKIPLRLYKYSAELRSHKMGSHEN